MDARQSVGGLGQRAKVKRSASANPLVEIPSFVTSSNETANTDAQNLHSSAANRKIRWRWGVLAALALALLSLYPQIDLWITRGADWQGSYASLCYDEEEYAAYIQGLLLGRPRRTEPLEIPDPSRPPHESFLSIQFVPAYLLVAFTRVFGLTVAQTFIALMPLMAFLTALMLFYLLASITRNEAVSAVSTLAVLICGTLAATQSTAWYSSFLFLRRYEPAAAFPAFFGFIALIWQAFIGQGRRAWYAAVAAGAVFVALIFSYFFLWTAAAAWLACWALVWLVARHAEWPLLVKRLAPTVLLAVPAFAVYAFMLAQRDPITDKIQLLNFTHAPDFYRMPEWIGAATMLLLLWGTKKGRVQWRAPVVLLASSLALMPFAVFNQQVITGRSLQPVHYDLFSANYLSLLALILVLVILWYRGSLLSERRLPRWLIVSLTCAVIGCGVLEIHNVTSSFRERNIARDLFMPVTKQLVALAAAHGKGPNEREVVFSPDIDIVSDNTAPFAPQAPFWSTHTRFASGLSGEEQQERYFQYLYYCGMRPGSLLHELSNNGSNASISIFNFKPYNTSELMDKVRQYDEYIATFDRERARHPEISYVVVPTTSSFDFTNLDRWYARDKGEQIGPFTLYQVKLR